MKEQYWKMYFTMKYRSYYFNRYAIRTIFICRLISGISLFIAVSGIASWIIWDFFPVFWAIVIVVIQTLQALSTWVFPYQNRESAFRFFIPQMEKLVDEISAGYRDIIVNNYDEKRINKLITIYSKRYGELNRRYFTDILQINDRISKKAENDNMIYFKNHYGV